MQLVIDDAQRRGMSEFDFLRGSEPYKVDWTCTDRQLHRPFAGQGAAGRVAAEVHPRPTGGPLHAVAGKRGADGLLACAEEEVDAAPVGERPATRRPARVPLERAVAGIPLDLEVAQPTKSDRSVELDREFGHLVVDDRFTHRADTRPGRPLTDLAADERGADLSIRPHEEVAGEVCLYRSRDPLLDDGTRRQAGDGRESAPDGIWVVDDVALRLTRSVPGVAARRRLDHGWIPHLAEQGSRAALGRHDPRSGDAQPTGSSDLGERTLVCERPDHLMAGQQYPDVAEVVTMPRDGVHRRVATREEHRRRFQFVGQRSDRRDEPTAPRRRRHRPNDCPRAGAVVAGVVGDADRADASSVEHPCGLEAHDRVETDHDGDRSAHRRDPSA